MSRVIVVNFRTWKQCFVSPGSTKRWWAIHCDWLRKMLNSVYLKHTIWSFIMIKVEWIRNGRNDECSALTNTTRIDSGIGPRIALPIALLRPRTISNRFNLSMCNRIMCFALHSQNVSVSQKKRGNQFEMSDKKQRLKFWYPVCWRLKWIKDKKFLVHVEFIVHVNTVNQCLSKFNMSARSLPYSSRVLPLLR